jgi:hypothetical protein
LVWANLNSFQSYRGSTQRFGRLQGFVDVQLGPVDGAIPTTTRFMQVKMVSEYMMGMSSTYFYERTINIVQFAEIIYPPAIL